MIRQILLCLTALFLCIGFSIAQRHYAGISGVDASFGLNTFGDNGKYVNISLSKYKNRTTYLKTGLNYFEKSHTYYCDYCAVDHKGTARNYFLDAKYFKTIATNLTSLYFNVGAGGLMGVEGYSNPDSHYRFIFGPIIAFETEYFVTSRIAILGGLTENWSPISKINKWNTVWNVGVKYLLY